MAGLSKRGAQFIGRFEGWRDRPYTDAAGHATIGFGHLIHHGPVTARDRAEWGTLTLEQGLELLIEDAAEANAAVDRYVLRELAQCERDALVSFVFNCGGGALAGSVGEAVNAHRDPTSCLAEWCHAGGTLLDGLLRRRQAEARLFLTGDYGDGRPPAPPPRARELHRQ
jgi:lysozyme